MMLARQKAMFATLLTISSVILIATLSYIAAADRIGRQQLAPQVSQIMAGILQTELSHHADLLVLQTILQHMTQHYQIDEAALYNDQQQRLIHSYQHTLIPQLNAQLAQESQPTSGQQMLFPLSYHDQQGKPQRFTLAIINRASLPGFFLLDTLTTTLFVVSLSALLCFLLYLAIRRWQRSPYDTLLQELQQQAEQPHSDVQLSASDPDIQPLVNALNDIFWLREQRHRDLRSARHQAESARWRATRLSDETRRINDHLAKEVSIRRGIETQLKNTQSLLDNMLHAMPSAIFAVDEQLRIVQCNQQAGEWLQHDPQQLVGHRLVRLIPELETQHILFERELPQPEKIERLALPSLGQNITGDLLIYPIQHARQANRVIRIDDVSVRLRMEEIMVQTEKMMSVGGLAAGMAHEINNPLGAILQNVQNIRRRMQAGLSANQKAANQHGLDLEKLQHYLQQRQIFLFIDHIQQAGERAATIIRSMLQFARNDHLQKRHINIHDLITTSLTIATTDSDLKHIRINTELPKTLPDVACVPSEIEQVLLNLIKNAQQALDDSQQQTPAILIRAFLQQQSAPAPQQQQIVIQVEDNGPGIKSADIPHIFEPFYTTKDVGEGTGLGLSVSYFIITAHHQGQLNYQSGKDGGSCFEIVLPLNAPAPQTLVKNTET